MGSLGGPWTLPEDPLEPLGGALGLPLGPLGAVAMRKFMEAYGAPDYFEHK